MRSCVPAGEKMPRSGSTPLFRTSTVDSLRHTVAACAEPEATGHQEAPALPLSFRYRNVPSLDGGRSPFVEPRKEPFKLPSLALPRGHHLLCYEEAPDITPTSQGPTRRVAFSAPHSKLREAPGTPLFLPPAPLTADAVTDEHSEKRRLQRQRRQARSLCRSEKTEEEEIANLKRSSRRRSKTWQGPSGPASAVESALSTPSVLSSVLGMDSPRSSAPTTASPADLRGSIGSDWIKGAPIGSGSHGCVFKALDKQSGRLFAVKRGIVDDNSEDDKKYKDRLMEELRISKDLQHPNIVATLGFEMSKNCLSIYLEYVPGGSVASLLSEFGPLSDRLLRDSAAGLVEGLDYLHSRDPPVVHRDIKGANILVDLDFCVKLADFGCSKRSDVTTSFTTIGSIPWMAPEVVQQQDGHGRKADVWSLGCALIEMASAEKPWGKGAFENVMYALRHIAEPGNIPPIPDALDEEGEEFVRGCLNRDPEKRPKAAHLRNYSFVHGGMLR